MYFGAFHHRLQDLYDCDCDDCNQEKQVVNLSVKNRFKTLLKSAKKAFKKLHKKKRYSIEDLVNEPEYRKLITDTSDILSLELQEVDLEDELITELKQDIFIFSGLKTHAQLSEASKLLFTEEKKIKSFSQFTKDIEQISANYNERYLEAEYNFSAGSIQAVERWESFDNGDKYYLQYRTANDERVRETHKPLHNITLPKSDQFWKYFFAPNGWRCRCVVVQVLAYLNEKSSSKDAMKKGKKATSQIGKNGKNKLEIFRFNPALDKVVFPPNHPYHKIAKSKDVKSVLKDGFK